MTKQEKATQLDELYERLSALKRQLLAEEQSDEPSNDEIYRLKAAIDATADEIDNLNNVVPEPELIQEPNVE